jgi:nucleotide-binding universal stress UspA family protein
MEQEQTRGHTTHEEQTHPSWLMETRSSIVVPLDGREAALSALPVAQQVASLAGATLHLVYVDPQQAPSVESLIDTLHLSHDQIRGVVLDPLAGSPADQILSLARRQNAAFIVLCTHSDTRDPARGLGSTAEAILAAAPCPVLFVRPERGNAPWRFGSALVPHDGTPTSSGAIKPMVRLLRKANAKVWVLYVSQPGKGPQEAGALSVPRYVDQPQHEWPSWIVEFRERFGLQGVPDMRFAAAAGDPGREILNAARNHAVDLVVLGWRGTLASKRALTLKRILAEAPCPVLVFRVKTEPIS